VLGTGAFGKILKIKRYSDNRMFAMKMATYDFETLREKDKLYD
jgi:serine/threonine protein kinase